MDAKITKNRVGHLLSYDWIKILAICAAVVVVRLIARPAKFDATITALAAISSPRRYAAAFAAKRPIACEA